MAEEKQKNTKKNLKQGKILIIPTVESSKGTGHLQRSISLLKSLGKQSLLYIPRYKHKIKDLAFLFTKGIYKRIIHDPSRYHPYKMIILDNMTTSLDFLNKLPLGSPLIAIDEGAKTRPFFSYLIDTLPSYKKHCLPNTECYCFLKPIQRQKLKIQYPFNKILISFGGEDSANLSAVLVTSLLKYKIFKSQQITVVQGPLFKNNTWPQGIKVLKGIKNLPKLLYNYDLVFTHFGITLFEALTLNVPVILFNPTIYHRNLSRASAIPEIGVKKPDLKKLKNLVSNKKWINRLSRYWGKKLQKKSISLEKLITKLKPSGSFICPLCNKRFNPSLARFKDRTYFHCTRCSLIYMNYFDSRNRIYNRDYFFKEYKNQYGKTYLEDFECIKKRGRNRLKIILGLLKNNREKNLLDIGSAYGPFLQAALEYGFKPFGIELNRQAAQYIRNTLNIPCSSLDFEKETLLSCSNFPSNFNVVSMWFVIEHFKEVAVVLKRVNSLLKTGGIFAFSTPSFTGISAKKNKINFLEKSPQDHFTIWSPEQVKKQLMYFGFKVKKIVISGHHPERFIKALCKLNKKTSFFRRVLFLISYIFKLGDTFEVYAEKIGDLR